VATFSVQFVMTNLKIRLVEADAEPEDYESVRSFE
jgi:hypothetical protein